MDAQNELQGRDLIEHCQSSHGTRRHYSRLSTLTSSIYLMLAVSGAIATWTYNILWMCQVDRAITLQEFVLVGFQGTALLGSLASDFWLGSLASVIFMIIEGRRLRMPQLWICLVMTFVVAWACSLPFFLYLRERALSARTTLAYRGAGGDHFVRLPNR